eukprot:Anaeramoba_ignava/a347240_105.p1 GENE.a347240_105~~a347240_105.p1  ORF type:complete len:1633 (+),score=550.04 a347240_105:713-4900(+)
MISEDFGVFLSDEGTLISHRLQTIFLDLDSNDTQDLYLVCQFIRKGPLVFKEKKVKVKSMKEIPFYRRPFGFSFLQITSNILNQCLKNLTSFTLDVYTFAIDALFPDALKLILNNDPRIEKKPQNIKISLRVLTQQMMLENPENESIVKTNNMRLPRIIFPTSNFNNIFITTINGDFPSCKSKNILIKTTVRQEKGQVIQNCIFAGNGLSSMNEFSSLVYYHKANPQFNETFRVNMSFEQFSKAHIFFELFNCVGNPKTPDKKFAYGFLYFNEKEKILQQGNHKITLYKFHQKTDPKVYLKPQLLLKEKVLQKDELIINFNICSTIIPQNTILMNFFNWRLLYADNPRKLNDLIHLIKNMERDDYFPFIGRILDNLFQVLHQHGKDCASEIFKAFIFLVSPPMDIQQEEFYPIIEDYLNSRMKTISKEQEYFNSLHGYFVECLRQNFQLLQNSEDPSFNRSAMKGLGFAVQFIVFSMTHELKTKNEQNEIQETLKNDRNSLSQLMDDLFASFLIMEPQWVIGAQTFALKNCYSVFVELDKLFDIYQICKFINQLFQNIGSGRGTLDAAKISLLNDISKGILMETAKKRKATIPLLFQHIQKIMYLGQSELEKSTEIIYNILNSIEAYKYKTDTFSTYSGALELTKLPQLLIKAIRHNLAEIQAHENEGQDEKTNENKSPNQDKNEDNLEEEDHFIYSRKDLQIRLVSIFLSFFQRLKPTEVQQFLAIYSKNEMRQANLLIDVFQILKHIITESTVLPSWEIMELQYYSITLKIARQFTSVLQRCFQDIRIYRDLWSEYFNLLSLLIQTPKLQIEALSQDNLIDLFQRFGDMRFEIAHIIQKNWDLLNPEKIQLISSISTNILSLILLEKSFFQSVSLDIYFSMIEIEFDKTGEFKTIEFHTLSVLDDVIENGAYPKFEARFFTEMSKKFAQNIKLKEKGFQFLETMKRIISKISLIKKFQANPEFEDERLELIAELVEYLRNQKQYLMILRYLHMAYNLNISKNNYLEAGFSLNDYSELLDWDSQKQLPEEFEFPAESFEKRKERVLKLSIDSFEKAQNWEKAVELTRKLKDFYEKINYDFNSYCLTLSKEIEYISQIPTPGRTFPKYFRIGFYGKGFEDEKYFNCKNKEYIYRADHFDLLSGFVEKLQEKYPSTQITSKDPTQEIIDSDGKYIQVAAINPVFLEEIEGNENIFDEEIPDFISNYRKNSNIQVFLHSTPFRKNDTKSENEFKDLWLKKVYLYPKEKLPTFRRRVEVIKKLVVETTPIETAIISIEKKNQEINEANKLYSKMSQQQTSPFSMLLQGVINAAVNGGVMNYKEAFLYDNYIHENPSHASFLIKLKNALRKQLNILEKGLKIHEKLVTVQTKPLHLKLSKSLMKLKRLLLPYLSSKDEF